IIIILCFLFVANLFIYKVNDIYIPPGDAITLGENWHFSHDGETVYSGSTNHVILMEDRSQFPIGIYDMKTTFAVFNEMIDPVLVIPAMEGNGLRVYINDQLLAMYGDMELGRTSRWNTSHIIKIPRNLIIKGRNNLHLEVLSLYKIGIHSTPYIVDSIDHRLQLFGLQFFSNYSILIIIGNISALGLILILLGASIGTEGLSKTLLGIGLLILSAYMIDYQYIELLPIDYVIFKKIIVSFSFIAPIFVVAGINLHMIKRIDFLGYMSMGLFLGAAIYILSGPLDSVAHEIRYGQVNLVYGLFLLDSLWLFFTCWEKNNSFVLLAGLTFTGVIMVHDIGAYHSRGESILFFHYGINFLIMSIAITMVGDTVGFYKALKEEKRKFELAHKKSMVDALTGAFNRRVIQKIDSQLCDHYSLLLIDLDHFKEINDTYGHFCGDKILKTLVNLCNQIIREEDYCIRMGGDEFVLFLPHCRIESALTIAQDIKNRISTMNFCGENEPIKFSCSIGVSEHEKEGVSIAMQKTDLALYRAKVDRDSISV
ncbi:MAG: GGDEF domain-containing protein, partial [Spirochaetaceae bacterium]|nr:GGDEF domain-containing protein [Spirochaetaceae bacterium]